jgi:tetratricopeptide (TPR) repeat protein
VASAVVGALRVLLSADTAAFEKALSTADASTKKLANTMKRDLEPSQTRINQLVRQFAGSKEIGAAENYARAVQQAGGAANLTAQHQEKVNATLQRALVHYKALGQQAPAHILELEKATRRLEAPTDKLTSNLDMVMGRAKALAGVFGVTLGAAAIGSFVKGVFDAADQVVDLSQKMGVSIEAAQRFQYAARQSGAEIEDVSRAIVKMNDNLAEGNKSTVSALKSAGLSFQDIRAMKPEDAFRAIADAIGRIPDPMRQTQVAMELFGKAGAELLPMIRDGALQAADAIDVMSDETARKLEAAKQSWENFWNRMTIVGAGAIVKIMGEWDKLVADFTRGVTFLYRLATQGPAGALALGVADHAAEQNRQAKSLRDRLERSMAISHGAVRGRVLTKEEEEAIEKWNKEVKDLANRLSGEKLDDTIKRLAQAVDRIGGASKIAAPELKKLREELNDMWMAGAKLPKVLDDIRLSGPLDLFGGSKTSEQFKKFNEEFEKLKSNLDYSLKFGPSATFTGDILGQAQKNLATAYVDFGRIEHAPKWVRDTEFLLRGLPNKVESGFKKGMEAAFAALPQTILGAFQGGGNVGQSIGGLIGGGLLKGIGDKVGGQLAGSFLGKGLGAAVGSVIPGVGTLLGGLFGGALDNLFGGEGRRVNDLRDQFMAAQGGLEGVHKTIAQFGNDPQLMAAFNRLYFTGKEGDFNKGMDAYQKRLREIQTALGEVGGKLSSLTSAASAFGGVLPNSLKESAKQLLGMTGLTAEMRKQLEALTGQPSWKVLEERADALGIDKGALGAGFNQSKVKDLALGFVRDITMFTEAGADADGVLRGMADEISGLLVEAAKTGAQLPKTLEPYIKRLGEMGLLIDENGNAIDMGAFSFADFQDDALIAMKDLLTEIKDILAKAFPAAASAAARAIGQMGDAARGAFGGFRTPTFGSPEQGLHGWSLPDMNLASMTPSVSPASDFSAEAFSASGQMMTVIYQADGRELSRTIMPYIGGETRRLGLAPR